MPAQPTARPSSPGSTLLALIAVMGIPAPSEMIPSTKRCRRIDSSAAYSRSLTVPWCRSSAVR